MDVASADRLGGWIFDTANPKQPVVLDIVLGGELVSRVEAGRQRKDLLEKGIGHEGRCSFDVNLSGCIDRFNVDPVVLRISGTPFIFYQSDQSRRAFHSRFGGLWIDRTDVLDQLRVRVLKGALKEEMAVQIFRFLLYGYTVIERAVAEDIADRINEDVEEVWRREDPRLRIETHEPDRKLKIIPVKAEYRLGITKLLDLYGISQAARLGIMSPRIVEFLTMVFDAKPWAFQSLHFTRGSQQSLHKDTAYVKVVPPINFAASWIALEDVKAGTGELEYLVGSHRVPDFQFRKTRKWILDADDEHSAFLQSLLDDETRFGLPRKSFIAKKGDVLIWHSDLAHGGTAIWHPNESRKSLVTHYCPSTARPWYLKENWKPLEYANGLFTSEYEDLATARIDP